MYNIDLEKNSLFNNKRDHVPLKDAIALNTEFKLLIKEPNSPTGPLTSTILKLESPKKGKAKLKIERLVMNIPRPRGGGGVFRNNEV